MALDMRRFIQRFVEEAADHLPRLREGVNTLAQDAIGNASGAAGKEHINELFRSAHTLKGSSRMLKLAPITALAHSMEELLSAFREGSVAPTAASSDLLNQAIDALDDQVGQLAQEQPPTRWPTQTPRSAKRWSQRQAPHQQTSPQQRLRCRRRCLLPPLPNRLQRPRSPHRRRWP